MKCPGEQLKTSQSGLPLMCSERSSADVVRAVFRWCVQSGLPLMCSERSSADVVGAVVR